MANSDRGRPPADAGFRAMGVAAMLVAGDQTVLEVNRAFELLTGWPAPGIAGQSLAVLRSPDSRADDGLADALATGTSWEGELRLLNRSGAPVRGFGTFRRIDEASDRVFVGTIEHAESPALEADTSGCDAAAVLLETAGRLGLALGGAGVAQVTADTVVRIGARRAAVAVVEGDELRVAAHAGWDGVDGVRLDLGVVHRHRWGFASSLAQLAGDPTLESSRLWVVPVVRDDEVFAAILFDATPDDGANGPPVERVREVALLAAVAFDNLAVLEELRDSSDRDPLTGLLTRASLLSRFSARLDGFPKLRFIGAAHVKLDHFRRVNEALGYAAADEVLRIVAQRIRTEAEPAFLVARHGAAEFLLATGELTEPDELERRIAALDEAIRLPVVLEGRTIYPTASFGRAVRRRGGGLSLDTATALLRAADIGMHSTRARRSNTSLGASAFDLLQLDTDLHQAIARGEPTAHFQPIYAVQTRRLAGFEALARWSHPEYGPISPETFIALAEDNGLIHDLGRQMLVQARRFLGTLTDPTLTLNVNVSSKQLMRPGFADEVADVLDRDPALLRRVTLEVTESSLILDHDTVLTELHALRSLGLGVSIDDFGSGYSSLSQLQELPVTELKIDRSFVQRTGAVGRRVLEAVTALATTLDLGVVGEGVETREQLDTLTELNCARAQGFLFAPALPASVARRIPSHL